MALATRAAERVSGPAGKLELLEGLLGIDDIVESLDFTFEWLTEYAGVGGGLCALADADSGHLVAVAGHRVTASQLARMLVPLADIAHPFIQTMSAREPRFFPAGATDGGRRVRLLFGRSACWALPLASAERPRPAEGLLLVACGCELHADVAWAAGVLARNLPRLITRRALLDDEMRLRRERALLEAVINAIADPVLLTDAKGRLVVANKAAEALFVAAPGESEGRARAVELNNMFLSAALWRTSANVDEAGPQELLLADPADGSDLLFELLGSTVHDQRHGTGVVSVLRNVTDLRRANEELAANYQRMRIAEAQARSERDRLDLVISSVADPILVSDAKGRVTMMNRPAERLFTAPPGVDEADDDAQRRVRSNDARFSSFLSGLLSDGTSQRRRGELALNEIDTGSTLPVEAIAGKVVTDTGELSAVVTILHDHSEVLERQRLYERVKAASSELEGKVNQATAELGQQNELLRRQAIELEQASALKTQFLANMSHEFRTPLNAIMGYTSLLAQGVAGELSTGQRQHLERIESNARHLVGIVNEILDIARIEAGRMPVQVSRFTVNRLLKEIMSEMAPIIARSTLAVRLQTSPELGPIRSDRQKVKQIVLNLLSNALKFTSHGSVTITAHPGRAPGTFEIGVADTGIGIDPADRAKIFEDFRQVDSTVARPYSGTGLGLSICRRLATMIRGRIDLESEPGRGSTFTLVASAALRR
jgi:PAS domain S-box-containing protein